MTHWILIIFFASTSTDAGSSMMKIDFTNEKSCEIAARKVPHSPINESRAKTSAICLEIK